MVTAKTSNHLEWSHTTNYFDEIKIGTTKIATFIYTGPKKILSITPSCHCLTVKSTKYSDNTAITVYWKVKPTPKINRESKKQVTVVMEDEEVTLTLIGKIIQ